MGLYGNQQIIHTKENGFIWKVLATVVAGLILAVLGFFGGAIWSHNGRITTLEVYRVTEKEQADKLERRVDALAQK